MSRCHAPITVVSPAVTLADGRICGPLPADAPIIVSNGVGIDSVALLVELRRLNLRPSAIVTALVGRDEYGNEHRRFYQYLPVLEQWLAEVRFPPITYVWYEMKRQAKHFPYASLAGNCLANRTLPSISFRRHHSCSLKFKGERIDRWVTEQYGDRPCYRLVGYDLDEERRAARFSAQAPGTGPRSRDVYVHPLQLLGLNRADCEQSIAAAGLPSPGLSSCVFCASMRPEEVDELNPDELWLIVILEAHAQVNLHTIRGLWGHGERMTEYIIRRGLLPKQLVDEVWQKWSAPARPAEMFEGKSADEVLFAEVRRLTDLCG
ncbi:MAG: hypothetical protein IPL78_35850 [Chloroflexi bacterium]|nr:hypothetical protein [Chloroflexota bacterium]